MKKKFKNIKRSEVNFWKKMRRFELICSLRLEGWEEGLEILKSFRRTGDLNVDHKNVVYSILQKHKREKIDRAHYLYAISDGEFVKIGVSVDPIHRMNELQVSSPQELKLIWKRYSGSDKSTSFRNEKKLHAVLKDYHVRGEWFDAGCMEIVKEWKPKINKRGNYEK